MVKKNTFNIALFGLFTALIIMMVFFGIGFISVGQIAITLLHIPIIIAAIAIGTKEGVLVGLIVGVCCMIKAALRPETPTDPLFVNPIVSVLPRMLIGLFSGLVYRAFMSIVKNKEAGVIPAAACIVSAVVGTLTNTVFVLGALVLLYGDKIAVAKSQVISFVIATIIATNGIFELITAVIVVPIIATTLILLRKSFS